MEEQKRRKKSEGRRGRVEADRLAEIKEEMHTHKKTGMRGEIK